MSVSATKPGMATVSSHVLNGLDGTHAGDIRVQLLQVRKGTILFDSCTTQEGRLVETIDLSAAAQDELYELVYFTDEYWNTYWSKSNVDKDVQPHKPAIPQVVFRFTMPNAEARYHMPLILNPHSYSCWHSGPEV